MVCQAQDLSSRLRTFRTAPVRTYSSVMEILLPVLLAIAGCLCSTSGLPTLHRAQSRGFGSAKHVIIFGCDGFGGMYLENATSFLPNVNKFYMNGSYTTVARDQMPSVSAPNWGTTLTGMGPEESGIPDDSWLPPDDNPPNVTTSYLPPISGRGKIPETMWRVAKNQDSSVVVAVTESWDWIHNLVESGIVDYEYRCKENDSLCGQEMSNFVAKHQPNLMFIHFDSIDEAGHHYTWGSPEYYDAVKNVDSYIGEIMKAFEDSGIYDQTLFILTADHGGYAYSHGQFDEVCMYIPALFMGPQVKKGYQITGYTTDRDFAPTALNALGLQPGKYMVGKVVEEIYQ